MHSHFCRIHELLDVAGVVVREPKVVVTVHP